MLRKEINAGAFVRAEQDHRLPFIAAEAAALVRQHDKDFFDADAVKAVASSITTAALLISDDGAAEGYIKTPRERLQSPIISILGQKDSAAPVN